MSPRDSSPLTQSLLSMDSPVELPADIEREIFEVTARNYPGTAVKLALLSKTTQYWMEWLIYETVTLAHPISRTDAFLRTIEARPAEFFSQRIKYLYLSYVLTFSQAQKILSVCKDLTQLVCWAQDCDHPGWLQSYLEPPLTSNLTRLSVKLETMTRKDCIPSFRDEIYQNLTHLEIVLPPPVNLGMSIDWTALLALPRLKHLIMGDLCSPHHFYLLPVLRGLLDSTIPLETLAVISKEPQMVEALECQEFDDPRLVILPRFNWPMDLPTYWAKVYTGELDLWESSAQKARKQRLEWNERRRTTDTIIL